MRWFQKCFDELLWQSDFARTKACPHRSVVRKVREQDTGTLLNTEKTGEPFHEHPNTLPDFTLDEIAGN